MKKYMVYILMISMLLLCGCKSNENTVSNVENERIVIDANAQEVKMSFRNSNDNISTIAKEIATDKFSTIEKYTKNNIENGNFNILGVEYQNIDYYTSEKNKYRETDENIFKNDDVKISVSSEGKIVFCRVKKAIKKFENETTHSEELAKKYLELIYPNYDYNGVQIQEIQVTDQYVYTFYKTINEIRTSDAITIFLNSKGEFTCYSIHDVDKFDNIQLENFNYNDFLQRIDEYVNKAYKDMIIDYSVHEDGPIFNVFEGNNIELNIPIVVNVNNNDGEFCIIEEVVFELN